MTEHTEEQTRRAMWEYAILRSFDVPDIITPENAISSIAQAVIDGTGSQPSKGGNQGSIEVTRKIVGSIVRLGATGALDPLVIEARNTSPFREAVLSNSDLSQNDAYAGFVLDTVTDWVRANPQMPSHLLSVPQLAGAIR